MIPMNLMKNRKAGYIVTGQWAKKAYQEAQIYGEAVKLCIPPRIRRFLIFRIVLTWISRKIWIMCTSARIIRSTEQNTRSFRIPRDTRW